MQQWRSGLLRKKNKIVIVPWQLGLKIISFLEGFLLICTQSSFTRLVLTPLYPQTVRSLHLYYICWLYAWLKTGGMLIIRVRANVQIDLPWIYLEIYLPRARLHVGCCVLINLLWQAPIQQLWQLAHSIWYIHPTLFLTWLHCWALSLNFWLSMKPDQVRTGLVQDSEIQLQVCKRQVPSFRVWWMPKQE